MTIPTYTNPNDPDFNDPLNYVIPLSDKDIPDEQIDEDDEDFDEYKTIRTIND